MQAQPGVATGANFYRLPAGLCRGLTKSVWKTFAQHQLNSKWGQRL